MIIKKYIVNNMNEAMTRIRYELGKDAVIISQRKIRKPGIKGFFAKKVIEVTAAAENPSSKKEEESMEDSLKTISNIIKNESEYKIENNMSNNQPSIKDDIIIPKTNIHIKDEDNKDLEKDNENSSLHKEDNYELTQQIKEMKDILNKLSIKKDDSIIEDSHKKIGELNDSKEYIEIEKMKKFLRGLDIDAFLVDNIIEDAKNIKDPLDMKEKVKKVILNSINISTEDNFIGKVIFVGPTGVGKTTTIAKLAGKLSLIEKKKVGLITLDTYRIGAVDQLRTYADIMGIDFKVVMNQKEMKEALKSMENMDTILIDTTGRSSKNIMQISELRSYINKIDEARIYLVLSCTTKDKDIDFITEAYKILKYNNVIITKLDETSSYGSILQILNKSSKPLSLVSTGQNVPDDIKVLSKEELLKLIFQEDTIC
ncbi:flagellar biosynthesis protein FlhF [Clostridium algidicarnis]|uniref:Flagellar biosynthesis protein FlhF n=1 Tax=Clostridium algidicarnis TaxID=37659 RepID=A0ABS6BZB9_9CLOT|nr:flagellar biosynthesis protein FlhF [Clostridium algidicarnis]MBU3202979.1 flagellar biosynthesis protein FlhF [Clostridium algidicarnis]MBU3211133.1 flagellar biosynthesis protein FlhF [Clostridium algidicarnis]MBU3218568.1 flagellar biosynthesis protein FlhF [Clostridium algidicarnis]MBU3222359.1 flagellar biosynthesis protein FlhF [Clostridium algidicarnis]